MAPCLTRSSLFLSFSFSLSNAWSAIGAPLNAEFGEHSMALSLRDDLSLSLSFSGVLLLFSCLLLHLQHHNNTSFNITTTHPSTSQHTHTKHHNRPTLARRSHARSYTRTLTSPTKPDNPNHSNHTGAGEVSCGRHAALRRQQQGPVNDRQRLHVNTRPASSAIYSHRDVRRTGAFTTGIYNMDI